MPRIVKPRVATVAASPPDTKVSNEIIISSLVAENLKLQQQLKEAEADKDVKIKQLNELKNKVSSNAEIEEELEFITNEKLELLSQIEKLKQELTKQKKIFATNERKYIHEIDLLKVKSQELQLNTKVKTDLDKALKDVAAITKQKNELLSMVDNTTSHNKTLKKKLLAAETKTTELEKELKNLQNELTTAEENIQKIKSENSSLQNDLTNATKTKNTLQKQLKTTTNSKEVEDVKLKLKNTEESNASLKKELDELRRLIEIGNEENSNLKDMIAKLQNELTMVYQKLSEYEATISCKDEQIERNSDVIQKLRREIEELTILNDEKDVEIDKLMTEINLNKMKVDKCKEDVVVLKEELIKCKEELANKTADNERLHTMIATKEASIARLRRMCEELQSEMSRTKRKVDALTTKCKIFEQQIEAKINEVEVENNTNDVLDSIESNISDDTISICCSNINVDETTTQATVGAVNLYDVVRQTLLTYEYLSNTTIAHITISFTTYNSEGKTIYWYGMINDGYNDSDKLNLSISFGFHEEHGEIVTSPTIVLIDCIDKLTLNELLEEVRRMNVTLGIEKHHSDSGVYIRENRELKPIEIDTFFVSSTGKVEVADE